MSKRAKVAFAINGIIAIGFAVLNITTDYVFKNKVLEMLMGCSFMWVILVLMDLAKQSRTKDKDLNKKL